MKSISIPLALTLLSGSLPAGSSQEVLQPPPAATSLEQEADAYEELNQQYLADHAAWKLDLQEASTSERRDLRGADPVHEYWGKFLELSDAGNGRAQLWLCEHVLDKKIKSKERGALLAKLFDTLVLEQHAEEWFGEVIALIHRHRRTLGEDAAGVLYGKILATCEDPESKAAALYYETYLFKTAKGADPDPQVAANLDRILEQFPDTSFALKIRASRAGELSAVGAQAPEFKAKTIDEFEFQLSDYRGKIVLLDFYGFW